MTHYKKKVFFSVKQVLVVSTKISMCSEPKNLGGLPYKRARDAHHTQGCKLQILVSLIQGIWDRKSLYMPIQVSLMAVLKEVLKKCHDICFRMVSFSTHTGLPQGLNFNFPASIAAYHPYVGVPPGFKTNSFQLFLLTQDHCMLVLVYQLIHRYANVNKRIYMQ